MMHARIFFTLPWDTYAELHVHILAEVPVICFLGDDTVFVVDKGAVPWAVFKAVCGLGQSGIEALGSSVVAWAVRRHLRQVPGDATALLGGRFHLALKSASKL